MPTYPKDRQHFNLAVFVVLKNERGEYLLQKRTNTSFLNGYYDCAASGHLERGETLQQCVVRETEEETGLKVNPESLKLIHIYEHDVGKWPYMNFIFVSDDFSGAVTTNEQDKVEDLVWFTPEYFPELCTLSVRLLEEAGFPDQLTYAYVDDAEHERIMGHTFAEL